MKTYSEELSDLRDERDQTYMEMRYSSSNNSYNSYRSPYQDPFFRIDMIENRIDEIERLRKTDHNRDYYIVMNRNFREESKKEKEMKANIPARTSMLKKLFDEDISLSHLPKLPLELWNIVAEYEGGVESSVLGIIPQIQAHGLGVIYYKSYKSLIE